MLMIFDVCVNFIKLKQYISLNLAILVKYDDRVKETWSEVTFNPAQPTIPVTTVAASGWRATWKKKN